jgi:D-beta-D-heptose 7-phosphate kinase/D-beta-D-heptose 1-phosphate adenosyltransferase
MLLSKQAIHLVSQELHAAHSSIVFTNGCFDILHAGHVHYLNAAKKLGDILIVGLNSDASVRRLKGPERPVNSESDRAAVLAALRCVDYITIFNEDTPYELISTIMPDILVKGGDYTPENVVGADLVRKNGGIVQILPFVPGKSSTAIINRIKQNESNQ